MRRRAPFRRRATRVVVTAVVAVLATAAVASAGDTLTQNDDSIVLTTPPGTKSNILIEEPELFGGLLRPFLRILENGDFTFPHWVWVTSFNPLFGPCAVSFQDLRRIDCPYSIDNVEVRLGDESDRLRIDRERTYKNLVARGEGGDDTLSATGKNVTLVGGNGDDTLTGGVVLYGGGGDDVLTLGYSNLLYWEFFPRLADGGPGLDSLNSGAGNVTLDGVANDDVAYGRVNVVGVEIFAFDGPSVIAGNADANHIEVRGGDDTVKGLNGNDSLYGQAGNDRLEGGAGNDYLEGGDGNDTIFGGGGSDRVVAGSGDDVIHVDGDALFGGFDSVICGAGDDTVYLDSVDVITAGCERVIYASTGR